VLEAFSKETQGAPDNHGIKGMINTNPWDGLPDESGRMNRSWFEGRPVDIQGWAISRGALRSASKDPAACVCVDADGNVRIGAGAGIESAVEAMAGFQPVVSNGRLVAEPSEVRHPRSAIGINHEGNRMWLVVVDGRQPGYSEGMSLAELAEVMLDLGCWDAVNLDGGGSSILGLSDRHGGLRVMNSPSGRVQGAVKIRPLPSILTIRRTSEVGGGGLAPFH
jgi:exopolysaccharide biosynthesis protein